MKFNIKGHKGKIKIDVEKKYKNIDIGFLGAIKINNFFLKREHKIDIDKYEYKYINNNFNIDEDKIIDDINYGEVEIKHGFLGNKYIDIPIEEELDNIIKVYSI